jgi:16S rRNA (cytosine1402-N4)-methyltransferase
MAPEAPLDMRMDRRNPKTAADIVNDYTEDELYRMIRDYGEDRFAGNIARNIVKARQNQRIQTAGQLNEIIAASIPKKVQAAGGHPAKRTYQAIRIELNRELSVLEQNLNDFIDLLNDDGRICIITFHSLEDRIVKTIFKKNQDPCTCPKDFPICVCGKVSKGKVITRKPILPGEQELVENSRSRSAKLRVFERKI